MKTIDEITSMFAKEENLHIADHFPYVVPSTEKIVQAEFRSKKSSGYIAKKSKKMMKSVIEFIELMWLYSDVKVYIFDNHTDSFFCKRKIMKHFSCNTFVDIKNVRQIEKLVKINCKNHMGIYFVFENFRQNANVYMFLDDVVGAILFDDIMQKTEVEKIASACHMFLRKKQIT